MQYLFFCDGFLEMVFIRIQKFLFRLLALILLNKPTILKLKFVCDAHFIDEEFLVQYAKTVPFSNTEIISNDVSIKSTTSEAIYLALLTCTGRVPMEGRDFLKLQ